MIDDQRPPRLSVQGFEPFHWGDTPAMRRTLPDGRQVGVVPMLFTWAVIVTNGDLTNPLDGYDDRWCYRGLASAIGGRLAMGRHRRADRLDSPPDLGPTP